MHDTMEELTAAEIATRIGRTERTVQRWIKNGKLPALPLANHRYGVNPSDLQHLALPEHISETGEIVLEAMRLDKKYRGGVRFVLLEDVGSPRVVEEVPEDVIRDTLASMGAT